MREVLIGFPSIAFAFGIPTLHSSTGLTSRQGRLRRPVRRQSRGYGGTGTIPVSGDAMPASPSVPATDVDSAYGVPVSGPATLRAHIVAVIGRVESEARWASLASVGRVDPFHCDACPLGLIGNKGGELMKRPGSYQAVVFAGVGRCAVATDRPTAFACRALADALADASELLHAERTDALRMGVGDDLMRELMVDVAHPPSLFA